MSMPIFDTAPEESEVVLAVSHRTKPLYPTEGPGDGRSWNEFFRDAKAPYREAVTASAEEPDAAVTVLEPGRDLADPLKAPGAAGTLARRLAGQGWEVRVRTSRVHVPAVLYVSDSDESTAKEYRKGDVRYAAHDLEMVCLLGVKRTLRGGVGMAIDVTWMRRVAHVAVVVGARYESIWIEPGNMSMQAAKTFDPVLGHEWRTTVRTPRKPRAWEVEEGAAPTAGLDWWLNAVCPKPEVKKREKKEAA